MKMMLLFDLIVRSRRATWSNKQSFFSTETRKTFRGLGTSDMKSRRYLASLCEADCSLSSASSAVFTRLLWHRRASPHLVFPFQAPSPEPRAPPETPGTTDPECQDEVFGRRHLFSLRLKVSISAPNREHCVHLQSNNQYMKKQADARGRTQQPL